MADYLSEGPFLGILATSTAGSLQQMVADAINQAGHVGSRQLKAVAEAFARQLGNPADVAEAHRSVALLAQDSVKRSFDQLVTAREQWASRQHYRAGAIEGDWHSRRFAGGVLRRALGDPDFFEATAAGIEFINVSMLNRKAAQWHRLAFGAGGKGSGVSERYQVTWGNVVVATLGMDEPASGAFVLPRGVWVGPEGAVRSGSMAPGSDMFFPAEEAKAAGFGRFITRKPRGTQGIAGHNFFGAGVRRLGRELPVAYEQLYREWWTQAQSGAGPLLEVTSTTPARPTALGSKLRTL